MLAHVYAFDAEELIFCRFWATVCKTVRPMLSDRCPVCLSCLSVTLVYCGQTVGRIKMKLGMQVGLGAGDFVSVSDGDPAPLPQKGSWVRSPHRIFGPCLLWPNGWMDQDATWHGCRPLSRRYCVTWEPSSPPQKGGRAPSPIFSPCLL